MNKLFAVVCLALAFVFAAVPAPAEAGTQSLWPNQFAPAPWSGTDTLADAYGYARKNINSLSAVGGRVLFESEVKLPAGTKITKLAVNASDGAGGGEMSVSLYRARFGGETETVASFTMNGPYARDWYYASSIDIPRVSSGYKYWVQVTIEHMATNVFGVQVSYR